MDHERLEAQRARRPVDDAALLEARLNGVAVEIAVGEKREAEPVRVSDVFV